MSPETLEQPDAAVDPRIAARRRSVAADLRRRRRRRTLVVLAVLTVAAGAWLLTRTALFDVDHLTVKGASHTSPADVIAASGIHLGEQLTDLDTGAAAAKVRALPWIATAAVHRSWGGSVTIDVTERTPVATITAADGSHLLVDVEGRVLGPDTPAQLGLVPLTGVAPAAVGATLGPEAHGALVVVGLLTPGVRSRVASVAVAPDGTLSLALNPQGTALLGPATDLPTKVDELRTSLAQISQTDLVTMDLTIPGQVYVSRGKPK